MSHSCYHYLNFLCPVCGKQTSPYRYAIKDGKKYHLECEEKIVDAGMGTV